MRNPTTPWLAILTALPLAAAVGAFADHGAPAESSIAGELRVDGKTKLMMKAGKRAEWSFSFLEPLTRRPLTAFDVEHEKLMHLIVVHSGLGRLAHIHPEFDAAIGRFEVAVNAPGEEASDAVPAAGRYFLFGEVKPKDSAVQLVRFELKAKGREEAAAPLTPDPRGPSGELRKYFKDDLSAGAEGDAYRVTVKAHRPGGMLHFDFNIQERMPGAEARYAPVADLEQWLGMPGHAMMISQSGERVHEKVFRHMHPMEMMASQKKTNTGPEIVFMAHGDMPPSGIYRLWGQFKRGGKILTFPFVVEL